jgi:hypothetical protein
MAWYMFEFKGEPIFGYSLDSSFVNLIFEGPLVTKALEQKQMQ